MKKIISGLLVGLMFLLPACSWFGGNGAESGCSCCRHGSCRPVVSSTPTSQPVRLRIVNVLEQELFDDAHIAGAKGVDSICVPFDDIEEAAQSWDKSVPVVVYCSNYFCSASSEAAHMLAELGFSKVFAYEGGMAEWYQLFHESEPALISGPGEQKYLSMVVAAPEAGEEADKKFKVITALELQNLIKEATISE